MQGGDQVREAYDTAYDVGVLRISKVPDGHGFGRRDEEQVVPLEFAPISGEDVHWYLVAFLDFPSD
jgi:hypothetical protein